MTFKNTLVYLLAAVFFAGCAKDKIKNDSQTIVNNTDNFVGKLDVNVPVRVDHYAYINWTKITDKKGDSVTYTVMINGKKIDSNLHVLNYHIDTLQNAKEYQGKIVAKNPHGDSLVTSFTLIKYQAYFLNASFSGGNSIMYKIATENGVQQWAKTYQAVDQYHSALPAIVNDTMFVSSANKLFAVNFKTGAEFWDIDLPAGPNVSLLYKKGVIYFTTYVNVMAVDVKSHKVLWQYTPPSTCYYAPIIKANVLYFSCLGKLYALNILNGSKIWDFDAASAIGPLSSDDDRLYFTTIDNYFYRLLALNGLGGKVPLDVDGLHAPITYGNGYAVVAAHNKFYAFRKTDGELVWTKNFSSDDEYPIINNNTVYVSSEHKIYAINLADGKILWTYNSPGRIGGMLYANNVLYTSNASSGIGDDPGYGFIEINTINGAIITQSFGSMYIFFHQFLPVMNINGVIYQSNQSSMNR